MVSRLLRHRGARGSRSVPRRLHWNDHERNDVRAVLHAVRIAAGCRRSDGRFLRLGSI